MTFSELVRRELAGSGGRDIVVDAVDPIQFETLERAVVILHATWSGPSVKVVREYAIALHRVACSLTLPPELYVFNWDKLSVEYVKRLPGPFGGNGETFFVKNGTICHHMPHYTDAFEGDLLRCFSDVGWSTSN